MFEGLGKYLDNAEKEGKITPQERWRLGVLYTAGIGLVLTSIVGHVVEMGLKDAEYTDLIPHMYIDLAGLAGAVTWTGAALYFIAALSKKKN